MTVKTVTTLPSNKWGHSQATQGGNDIVFRLATVTTALQRQIFLKLKEKIKASKHKAFVLYDI